MNRKLNTEEIRRVSVDEYRRMAKIPLVLVLDNVRSMHNIGAVLRTADAFCIEKVVLCGITATPPNNEIHKSALGAEFSVCWEYSPEAQTPVRTLIDEGYRVLAVEQTQDSTPLGNLHIEGAAKYALVLGNEVSGVEQATIDLCDGSVEIPQYGTKHSINVSVACGIVVWTFFEKLRNKRETI